MQTKNKKLVITIALSIFVITLVTSAQKIKAETIENDGDVYGVVTNEIPKTPAPTPLKIQEQIRAKVSNVAENQGIRNKILEQNKLEPNKQKNILEKDKIEKKLLEQKRNDDRPATTSGIRRDDDKNNPRIMVQKTLKERKENIAKQFNVALQNLIELRKRIGSRIEKDKLNNKDLSSVSEYLKVADTKIAATKEALNKLREYSPTETTTGMSSTTVNLDQVKNLIENVQKSIKEAHKALVDVITAIAKISKKPKPSPASINSDTPTTTIPTSSSVQ